MTTHRLIQIASLLDRLDGLPSLYRRCASRLAGIGNRNPHRSDLDDKYFYLCSPCDAYVGCHPGSTRPLGRLANAELRAAKVAAHAAFDPLWSGGQISRNAAYKWLAEQLGIERRYCHIGSFDVKQCERVVEICKTIDTEKGN